jgi:hypothetical protein
VVLRRLVISLTLAMALVSAAARAAEPPNHKDPCSKGGRDSCSTTGVGAYESYRYGVRWFGDYRGAIDGVDGATFCLDLRFWYPGRAYDYELSSSDDLHNRDGDAVPADNLRRMNYAMWTFGRTTKKASQGAVMLYVHHLMGDAAPGEVDPAAGGDGVRATYERIARDADRYAGPYRVELTLPKTLAVRRKTALQVRVLAASGRPVPHAQVTLQADGADGLPAKVDTGDDGVAQPAFTPGDAKGGVQVTATSGQLPAARPKIYVPNRKDAARNGQRLAAPASAAVSATASADVAPAQLTVTTTATPATLLLGAQSRDAVTIGGAYHGWSGLIDVRLFGPFRSPAAISCVGAPLVTTSYSAGGGPSLTPALTPPAPGWYAYQLTIASTDDVGGVTTSCPVPAESLKVEVQPAVATQVSAQTAAPGTAITDSVAVSGLGGEAVTVAANLYGPYPSPDKMTCAGPPFWTGSITAGADGTYVTDPVTLTVPGYYTYRESIAAGDFVRAADTTCAGVPEMTVVPGKPVVHTQVSAQDAAPGAAITDTVAVSGLGALSATVNVALYGPFATRDAIRCDGPPLAVSALPVAGDGSYTTEATTLTKAGYYAYQESIAATAAFDGVATACGDAAETTFARGKPAVKTGVSDAVVRPGSSISDHVEVSGLGQTPATVEVRLFGPFASRAAIDCGGTPLWKGTVDVAGDGATDSAKVKLDRAGFYTYRERIVGTPTVVAAETACADEAETSLSAPLILTGRGDVATSAQAGVPDDTTPTTPTPTTPGTTTPPAAPAPPPPPAVAKPDTVKPTRVRLAARGIDARVYGVDIDVRDGALAIPKDIDRVGWWRDGAAPGSSNGAILLAGHVDSAKRGAGAFYALKSARRGDTVTVTSDDGKTRDYRVTTMSRVRKAALPSSIFSRSGPRRLVLVTCGGPFDAKLGHYRDNIIVTALPR